MGTSPTTDLMSHFTSGGVLRHAKYTTTEVRNDSVMWFKLPGTEVDCDCADRENEREALRTAQIDTRGGSDAETAAAHTGRT